MAGKGGEGGLAGDRRPRPSSSLVVVVVIGRLSAAFIVAAVRVIFVVPALTRGPAIQAPKKDNDSVHHKKKLTKRSSKIADFQCKISIFIIFWLKVAAQR